MAALARAVRLAPARAARCMSSMASFDYRGDGDAAEFPRKLRGLDYDLNYAMANDDLTTRGDAFRNANVRDLIEFAPRSAVAKVSKGKAVQSSLASKPAAAFATDVLPGYTVMDVEEFEGRLEAVRSDCLSFAPQLFVQDGAVGASRSTELRVRVISDCPLTGLAVRSLLQKTPVYSPDVFPKALTVYVASKASPEVLSGSPAFTVVDVDPSSSKGTVIAAGPVSIKALRSAIATAAGRLMGIGGYRHVKGGSENPNITEARNDGILHWYATDRHYYPAASEPHPDLLAVAGDVITGPGAATSLVLGASTGAVAGAASKAGRLYAAHNAVWHASEGLSAFWGGASLPSAAAGALEALPAGALVQESETTVALSGPKTVAAPAQVVLIDPKKEGIAGYAAKLGEAEGAKLQARIAASGAKVVAVESEEQALAALSLA